jgi:hypothetical protein
MPPRPASILAPRIRQLRHPDGGRRRPLPEIVVIVLGGVAAEETRSLMNSAG